MKYVDSFLKTFNNSLTKNFASFQYVDKKHMTMFNFMGDFKESSFKLFYKVFLVNLFKKIDTDRRLHKIDNQLDVSQFYDLFDDSDHVVLDFFCFLTKLREYNVLKGLNMQIMFNYTQIEFTKSIRFSIYYNENQQFDFVLEENKYYVTEDLINLVQDIVKSFKKNIVTEQYFPKIEEGKDYYINDNYLFNIDIQGDNTIGFFLQDTEL